LTLTRGQALEDLGWLRRSLEYVYPSLYKYDDKASVDARFDGVAARIGDQVMGLDLLALISRTNAAVRCGHLYTIPQGRLAREVLNKKVLPFRIKVLDGGLYLLDDTSRPSIPSGSRILSINGRSDRDILDGVRSGIAADGYIETRKERLMERYFSYDFQGFDLYYHLHVDRSDTFEIEYSEYGTKEVKKVTRAGLPIEERARLWRNRYGFDERAWFKKPSPRFALSEGLGYAVLTISRSFEDKGVDPDYDSLLRTAFHELRTKEIGHLIVDLRDNEGGSEHQQAELLSYLCPTPFKLYQNVFLSHLDFRPLAPVVVERDRAQLLFNNDDEYMRRLGESLWINNYEYSDALSLKPPREDVFRGKLYVLVNGGTFSSAADAVADIQRTTDAAFIGEESGGLYEGPTGGDSIVVQLPHSEIRVRISPNIQLGYMYRKHPVGRGVMPTHPAHYSIEDVVAGRDLEMELATALVQRSRTSPP